MRAADFAIEQDIFDNAAMIWDNPAGPPLSGVGFSDTQTGSWMNLIQPDQKNGTGNDSEAWVWKKSESLDLMQEAVFAASEKIIVSKLESQSAPTSSQRESRKSAIIDVGKFLSGKILRSQSYDRLD